MALQAVQSVVLSPFCCRWHPSVVAGKVSQALELRLPDPTASIHVMLRFHQLYGSLCLMTEGDYAGSG